MNKNETKNRENSFAALLLKWNRDDNKRQMPWKGERNPYRIWLSEIILQQTRVEQGLQYYHRFVSTFPDITQLAASPDNTVFKLWEGLGYYSRCRNLLATARYIALEKKGVFPDQYEDIKALKGIGPYTAAAISSFAFDLPYAVVDGNVFRVLARYFGIDKPIDSTEGKKYFSELAGKLLDQQQPALYNQAIMDFGATICKPALPLCGECMFRPDCYAYQQQRIGELPVKEKKLKTRQRWFYYLVLEKKQEVAIRERVTKDIWQQLFEFPLIEAGAEQTVSFIVKEAEDQGWLVPGAYEIQSVSPPFQQKLSHQLIAGQFIIITLRKPAPRLKETQWVRFDSLKDYAFPRFIHQYLEKRSQQALF